MKFRARDKENEGLAIPVAIATGIAFKNISFMSGRLYAEAQATEV
jgi:hypothetical protein